MQKKLIALAIAAAFSTPALAADATVYGIVDAGIASVSGDGQKSDLVAVSGGLSGSRLGIKASEGLDNGMTAGILLEYSMATQTANSPAFGTRREMVTLSGDFGTVASGYLQTAVYDFNAIYDPSYGSAVSPIQSVNKGGAFLLDGAARASQAVAYISPKLMDSLTLAFNYATGLLDKSNLGLASGATTGLKTTATILSANYAKGPLTLGGVYAKTSNDDSAVSTSSEIALGASYDLGVAKVMGTYASDKVGAGTTVTNKMMSLSGVMPVAGGAAVATYTKNSMATANIDGSGFLLAYLRGLSKTTTAYVAFETVKNGSATNAYSVANNGVGGTIIGTLTNGGSSNLFAVGLRKKF